MHKRRWQEVCGFLVDGCESLEGSRHLRDIFVHIISNKNAVYATWFRGKALNRLRYHQWAGQVADLAFRLKEHLPKDEIWVALHLANEPAWPTLFWALLMSGHQPFLLDARNPLSFYEEMLAGNGVRYAISRDSGMLVLSPDMLTQGLQARDSAALEAGWANQVAFVTSGTSGQAQVFVHDGRGLVRQIQACKNLYRESGHIMYPPAHGPVRQLVLLPLSHIFSFVINVLWYPYFGKELVFLPSLNFQEIKRVCIQLGVTHICAVPSVFDRMVSEISKALITRLGKRGEQLVQWLMGEYQAIHTGEDLKLRRLLDQVRPRILGKNIRCLISGGARLSRQTAGFLNRLGYTFSNGYGMTELGILSVETSADPRVRAEASVGHPMNGVDFQVDAQGNLFIDSAYAAKGRLEQGRLTPISKPYPSGDCGRISREGKLWLIGRQDDVIIDPDGNRLHPAEVEKEFTRLQGLKEACLVRDEQHRVLACVLKEGANKEEVLEGIARVNLMLPISHKVHRVAWLKQIPRTPKGEFDRRLLTKSFHNLTLASETVASATQGQEVSEAQGMFSVVRASFARVLNIPVEDLDNGADFFAQAGGDSLSHLLLMADLEKKLGIVIGQHERAQMNTVYNTIEIVYKKTLKESV